MRGQKPKGRPCGAMEDRPFDGHKAASEALEAEAAEDAGAADETEAGIETVEAEAGHRRLVEEPQTVEAYAIKPQSIEAHAIKSQSREAHAVEPETGETSAIE